MSGGSCGKEVYRRLKSSSVFYLVPSTNCELKISNSFYFPQSYIDTVHNNLAHSQKFLKSSQPSNGRDTRGRYFFMLPMLYNVCPARQKDTHGINDRRGPINHFFSPIYSYWQEPHSQPQNLSLRKILEVIHPSSTQVRTSLSPHKLRHLFLLLRSSLCSSMPPDPYFYH